MGLFDLGKKSDGGPEAQAQGRELIEKYLVKSKYPFCLEKCLGDNLGSAEIEVEEKVCLAICVDKLHARYRPFHQELSSLFTKDK
jgi:hypothetical protein